MCARWRGRWCIVGHSFGSAAVLTAAQAPRLRGAARMGRGVFNLRRKATCIDSTTKSRATAQLGTLEELRANARSDPTRRRECGPPIDRAEGRRATTARPSEAGHEDGVPGGGCTYGAKGTPRAPLAGPDRGAPSSRRSDARPQAMAPGPHPST